MGAEKLSDSGGAKKPDESTMSLSARMRAATKDMGPVDTFRHTILSHVASENYDRASEEIWKYVESKPEFPQFKERVKRYAQYSVDLVNATKAKRSFPGLENLSMSKQQDLFDRAMEHFEDLQVTLKKIEQIEVEVRVVDVRSTVIVLRTAVYSMMALVALAFFLDVADWILPKTFNVVDTEFDKLVDTLFAKFKL